MAGPLKNARWERFAQELAKGMPAGKAYIEAGYKAGNAADARASELGKKKQVRARLAELTQRAAKKAGVTVERWERELARIAFSDMRDFAAWGSQAELTVDQRQLLQANHFDIPRRIRDLSSMALRFLEENGQPVDLKSVELVESSKLGLKSRVVHSVEEGQHGVKLKLHDKIKALELLGTRHGWLVARVEHSGTMSLVELMKKADDDDGA